MFLSVATIHLSVQIHLKCLREACATQSIERKAAAEDGYCYNNCTGVIVIATVIIITIVLLQGYAVAKAIEKLKS